MSTSPQRSLQVEEHSRAPLKAPPKTLIRSNGNRRARLNGKSHVAANGNGHGRSAGNRHATCTKAANGAANGSNRNGNVSPNSNGHGRPASNGHANGAGAWNATNGSGASRNLPKPRVFVAAENRLLREALSRMLTKNGDVEVITSEAAEPFQKSAQGSLQSPLQKEDLGQFSEPETPVLYGIQDAKILLLSSKGNLDQDLAAIRKIRSASPELLILLIDVTGDETNFLQCIRAGVRGYLPRDASAEDVVDAVRNIHAGHAVCPGTLCTALFRYIEREASCFPSASVHQRLGLTRREQQLIPLVAEGLTNKEIANRFCLSEQTVKNHLYRMKQKIGADDRLGIVQVCRTQGFMV